MAIKGTGGPWPLIFFVPSKHPFMRSPHETLSRMLISSGIQPSSFAYFLVEFENQKPKKRQSERSRLLTAELKAQAELIRYHLEN